MLKNKKIWIFFAPIILFLIYVISSSRTSTKLIAPVNSDIKEKKLDTGIQDKKYDKNNLVSNGDFELNLDKWLHTENITIDSQENSVFEGNGSLHIINKNKIWSFASQEIPLNYKTVKNISVSAHMKINNVVQGSQVWEKARISIDFKDKNGKNILKNPAIVFDAAGTFDWKQVQQHFPVPEGTEKIVIYAGMLNCTGEAWFDNIDLNILEQDKKIMKKEDKNNLVSNGDFELNLDKWLHPENITIDSQENSVFEGDGSLHIINKNKIWSFASQEIPLNYKTVKNISAYAHMKINNVVQGSQVWEKARISIDFKDKNGKNILKNPAIVFDAAGTFGWQLIQENFPVPEGTEKIVIYAGMLNCTGEVWFDNIKLKAF